MKAVILAAGEGIRMRPLTLDRPKQLVELSGKPLLFHIFQCLPGAIDEVIMVVGYKGEQIKKYLGKKFQNKKITYVEQKEKTGTGRALQLVRPYVQGEKFLLMYADDLHDKKSVEQCLTYERGLLVCPVENPERFGIVVTNSKNRISDIEEKPKNPKTNLAAVGVYVLDDAIFEYEPEKSESGEYFLTTMIKKMLRDHHVTAVKTSFWHPIGYPEDIQSAERILKSVKKTNGVN